MNNFEDFINKDGTQPQGQGSTEDHERADEADSTKSSERAVSAERTDLAERASHDESTDPDGRAAVVESSVLRERARKPGSTIPRERAASAESTVGQELPADLREIWGNDPNAIAFIQTWGPDRFRQSAIHLIAVQEQQRQKSLEPLRKDYLKRKLK